MNYSNNSNALDFDFPINVSGIPTELANINVYYLFEIDNFTPQEFDEKIYLL